MFVKSLKKLNEEVNEHARVAQHNKKICPKLGMLVLARLPHDGLYDMFYCCISKLICLSCYL